MSERRRVFGLCGTALLVAAFTGCGQNTEKADSSRGAKPPAQSATSEAQAPASRAAEDTAARGGSTVTLHGLQWSVPAGMTNEEPASAMRIAQYRIPSEKEGVKDGELAVFFFGGQGGGAQANLERWASQLKQPDGSDPMKHAKTQTITSAGGLKVTTIVLSGQYQSSGMGGGPSYDEPGWKLFGAVVEGPGGPWFFKAVGPEAVIEHWQTKLAVMIAGLRPAS